MNVSLASLRSVSRRWLHTADGFAFVLAGCVVLAVKTGLLERVPW